MESKYQTLATFLYETRTIADQALALAKVLAGQDSGGEVSEEYTNFKYTPTGTGVINGREVLTQTEDAINGIGSRAWAANAIAADALSTATSALGTAQTAETTANNASSAAADAVQTANSAAATAADAAANATAAYTVAQQAANNASSAVTAAQSAAANATQAAQDAANATTVAQNAYDLAQTANTTASDANITAAGAADVANQSNTLANQAVGAANNATTIATDAFAAVSGLDSGGLWATKTTDSIVAVGSVVNFSAFEDSTFKAGNRVVDGAGDIYTVESVDNVNQTVTLVDADADLGTTGKWVNPAVRYTNQTLTASQQRQAQTNINVCDANETVTLSANQTISGTKTFSTKVLFSTGHAISRNGSTSWIAFRGGTGDSDGASLVLSGMTRSGHLGDFSISAKDSSVKKMFIGDANGSLTWDSKEIERVNASGTGYIQYDSGLQICFGSFSADATITFAQPFVDTAYSFSATPTASGSVYADTKTTTGISTHGVAGEYIAVGFWK